MEIITIPLEGDLAHKDSMGNTEIIKMAMRHERWNRVKHSEFNPNDDQRTKLLQIWFFQTNKMSNLDTNKSL
jgi:redox-sensitive bicupin YhaK (pirin superfamily)